MVKYYQETINLYSQKFGSRVVYTRNELAKRGLSDKILDENYENPVNYFGIRTVAERLGALAQQLP